MTAQPDTTIMWCLEQLATENLGDELLLNLITHVTETRGVEAFEETLKVRLMLAGFSGITEITADTLNDLQKIAALLNQTEDEDLIAVRDLLLPPPELFTLIKTELVAQGWRNTLRVNARELTARLRKHFGQQPESHEAERFDELQKAATLPGFRAHVDRILDNNAALEGLTNYAFEAQNAMGPTLLEVINDDINSGNYIPGQPMQQAAPAVPAAAPPPAAAAPTAIQQAIEQLQRAGGQDPENQKEAERQMMIAAAALAGANAATAALAGVASAAVPVAAPRPAPGPVRRTSLPGDAGTTHTRRQNQRWTDDEVKRLIEACRKHGPGNWAKIEADNRDIWGPAPGRNEFYRTQVDLKDKWRNLAGHKGDRAHRNNAEAVAVAEYWLEEWLKAAETERRQSGAATTVAVTPATVQDDAITGKKRKQKNKAKRTGPLPESQEEEEYEKDEEEEESGGQEDGGEDEAAVGVDVDDVQSTEVMDELDDENDDGAVATRSKVAKKSTAPGNNKKKAQKKPPAKASRRKAPRR